MAVFYLDTSAVVKRYVQEVGTGWIRTLADPTAGNSLYLARITDVELTAALARRRGQPGLSQHDAATALSQYRQDFSQQYRVMEITVRVLRRASTLADRHALRGYDAVQLAAALEIWLLDASVVLVSADGELNAAALAEGLTVENPNSHP